MMIRNLLALTAIAATAYAAPALAETSVHITLTGKTQAEAYAAIASAARTVCAAPYASQAHEIYSTESCVQETVAAAMLKARLAPAQAPALVSVPLAATSIRVNLAGKSPAEAYAAIKSAAGAVCAVRVVGVAFDADSVAACVRSTVAVTVPKAQNPALAKYAASVGYEQLASN